MDAPSKKSKTLNVKPESTAGKSARKFAPPETAKTVSRLSILKHVVIVICVAAALLWLKSGESWYHEVVSTADTLDYDPYKVLDIPKNAATKVIKQQFRKLSLEWHPDKRVDCDQTCQEKFKQINESYKILSNPNRRQLYDTTAKVMRKSESQFTADMHEFEYAYTPELWDTIVKPSVGGKQLGMANHMSGVWVVFVGNGKTSTLTEHILPIWSDLAAQFYGRVSFLRVDADEYPDFEKRMPFRVRVRPAFFMMSPIDAPLFFTDITNFSPHALAQWIVESMPNPLRSWDGTDEELAKYLADYTPLSDEDSLRRIPVAVISSKLPSTLIKAAGIKTLTTMDWIQPKSSHFMDHMGPTIRKQVGNIKDGAAIVSTVHGEPYAKILGAKAYKLDRITREITGNANITQTVPGKYLKFIGDLTRKIVSGNTVPGYRENYLYLCGASDENKFCNVMRPNDLPKPEVGNWAQDNNATVQNVYLPMNHKSSQLSRLLAIPSTRSVLVQLREEKIAVVDASGIGDWQVAHNHHRYFPTYRKSSLKIAIKWCKEHPVAAAAVGVTSGIIVGLFVIVRRYFKADSAKKQE